MSNSQSDFDAQLAREPNCTCCGSKDEGVYLVRIAELEAENERLREHNRTGMGGDGFMDPYDACFERSVELEAERDEARQLVVDFWDTPWHAEGAAQEAWEQMLEKVESWREVSDDG